MKRILCLLLFFYFDVISVYARNKPKTPTTCKDKIEIKIQLPTTLKNIKIQFGNKYKKYKFNYYPMMAIDTEPIKCFATDKANINLWAKNCIQLNNCESFMVLKDDIIFNICYYKTKSEDDLIDGFFILDELFVNILDDSHIGNNVCLGSYLVDDIKI